MRRLQVISLVALVSCASPTKTPTTAPDTGATEASLMETDKNFAIETHARGIAGWMSFYAPDAIRVRYRGNIVKGLDAVRAFDSVGVSDPTTKLNWEPTDSYVFKGGTLGLTTGKFWITGRTAADSGKILQHGRYSTMWRRENGKWVVIMDGGYPEPEDVKQ